MKYKVCEFCGANLDLGEVCDCRKNEAASAGTDTTSKNNDAGIIVADNSDYVKDALNLPVLLRQTGATNQDIAETLKDLFPGLTRQVLSQAAHWEHYGVILHPDGIKYLKTVYGIAGRKKQHRRKARQLTYRVTAQEYERIERNMEKHGFASLQSYLDKAVAVFDYFLSQDEIDS